MAKKPRTKKEPLRTEDMFDANDTRPPDSGRRSKNQEVEQWLQLSYDFRYNVIKQKPEWKQKKDIYYLPIDKYKLLSIKRELDAVGHSISKDGLMDILCSSFAVAVNPVKDYFNRLVNGMGRQTIYSSLPTRPRAATTRSGLCTCANG